MSAEVVLGAPNFRISCRKLLETRGPLVYAWVRGGRALYVGMSRTGLIRPLSATHEVCWAFELEDELLLWRAKDRQEAEKLEAMAIRLLNPAYNANGTGHRGTSEARPEKPSPFEDTNDPFFDEAPVDPRSRAPVNLALFESS